MVGAACSQLLYVGGEQDASDVFLMRREMGQRDELGSLVSLKELPDIDIALLLSILAFRRQSMDDKSNIPRC